MKRSFLRLFLLFLLIGILIGSCTDEPLDLTKTDKNLELNPRINKYTQNIMTHVYLWADEVRGREPSTESDPLSYFEAYLYKAKDKWSYMDENYTEPSAGIDGYDDQFGYELQFFYYGGNTSVVAQICYVYPHSPAADIGLKRGDLIIKNQGHWLDLNNYTEIYRAGQVSLELADLVPVDAHSVRLVPREGIYTLTARKTKTNPILKDTILQQRRKKIGYLCYTEFANDQKNSLSDLQKTIAHFKSESIDELILDLRYNRGGYLTAARHLCSLLAPAQNVGNEDVLIYKQWNKELQSKSETEEHFDKSVLKDNLNLQRIYIITGKKTASASELLISGLRPYISGMVVIGNTTAGKYVGSQAYRPDDEDLRNYILHPIVFSYSNARKESVEGGIVPHYRIYENELNLGVLGDPEETLLQATLSLIDGHDLITSRSSSSQSGLIPFSPKDRKSKLIDDRKSSQDL